MESAVRELVRWRARGRCEYCGIPQEHVAFQFQIEHIIARQRRGSDDPNNLALACDRCNAYKGPNLTAIDPDSDAIVRLFHPRHDQWHSHFVLRGASIFGLTDIGRATVQLLRLNSIYRLELRLELGPIAAPSFL